MVVCQGELPFSIDVKGGENVVGRGAMIAGGVLVFPSMPNYYILGQEYFLWFLIVEMFPLIYGMPRNSSQFERYSCLKFVILVSGLKPHGVVAWVIEKSIINIF